jgi:hypothetical protein
LIPGGNAVSENRGEVQTERETTIAPRYCHQRVRHRRQTNPPAVPLRRRQGHGLDEELHEARDRRNGRGDDVHTGTDVRIHRGHRGQAAQTAGAVLALPQDAGRRGKVAGAHTRNRRSGKSSGTETN